MKKAAVIAIVIVIILLAGVVYYRNRNGKTIEYTNQTSAQTNTTTLMTITSPAFLEGQPIPKKYTCDDAGVNPPLAIAGVPAGARSLALILDDPDAPGSTWTHWVVWNIDPGTTSIAENSVPVGAMVGQASSGQNVYGGPCPPSGTHHYYFHLYALPLKLNVSSFSDAAVLHRAMDGNIIGEAELMGTYSRGQ